MILLDTHCLLWYLNNDERLGREARGNLDREWRQDGARHALAAISLWEIAMLVSKGRVRIGQDLKRWFSEILERSSIQILALDAIVAADSVSLPGSFHGDPSDRMIVATARHHDLLLMTADRSILAYAEHGHVRTIDARV